MQWPAKLSRAQSWNQTCSDETFRRDLQVITSKEKPHFYEFAFTNLIQGKDNNAPPGLKKITHEIKTG